MTSNAQSLPVDRVHALEDLLDMYDFRHEEVLLCEAFANAVDIFLEDKIKNPQINITLDNSVDKYYINFHNNGTPMTRRQFDKYHVIAGSSKHKGGGIGFAGVGAKVFLASTLGGEIFTISGKNNSDFMASKMFKTIDDVKFEEIDDLTKIFPHGNYQHEYGTTYRVKINQHAYNYFKESLERIIQFWWNFALLNNQFTVLVNRKKIKPFDPQTRYDRSFTWKKHKINCYCWISKTEFPAKYKDIVYSIHGKRIMNEPIEKPIILKDGSYGRIFCLANVSHIAKHIRTDKESFAGNWETNQTRQAVQDFFVDFLTEQGLVRRDISKPQTSEITNEITKELDQLLKTKDFKDLDPFLSPRKRITPTRDKSGDISISETEGEGIADGDSTINNPTGNDPGHSDETAVVEDSDGNDVGKKVERKSKGIRIILTDQYPDEPEESWVDGTKGAICINILHQFYIKMCEADSFNKLERFNVARLLIEALIKYKNDELKEEWDPKKTLDIYRNLLHKIWKG